MENYRNNASDYDSWGNGNYYSDVFDDRERLCARCHSRPKDKMHPETALCEQCFYECTHYKIPIVIKIAGIIILLLVIAGFISFPQRVSEYKEYKGYQELVDEGYIYKAICGYEEFLTEHPNETDKAIEAIDICMEYSYYDCAAYFYDTYIYDKSFSDADYIKLEGYYYEIMEYYNCLDLMEVSLEGIDYDSMSEEEISEMMCHELETGIGDSQYNQAVLYLYLGLFSSDTADRMEYLQKSMELEPQLLYPASLMAAQYRREGDLDKAKELIDQNLSCNKEDANTYRVLATIEMLEGKNQDAVEHAYLAYELDPELEYTTDTLMVAYFCNGQTEELELLKSEYLKENEVLDEDTEALFNGSMTIEEYYMGGD